MNIGHGQTISAESVEGVRNPEALTSELDAAVRVGTLASSGTSKAGWAPAVTAPAPLETYKHVAPPSIALTLMSWDWAKLLTGIHPSWPINSRGSCTCSACAIHYARMDSISRGEMP